MNTDKHQFPGGIRSFSAISPLLSFRQSNSANKSVLICVYPCLSVFICGFSFFSSFSAVNGYKKLNLKFTAGELQNCFSPAYKKLTTTTPRAQRKTFVPVVSLWFIARFLARKEDFAALLKFTGLNANCRASPSVGSLESLPVYSQAQPSAKNPIPANCPRVGSPLHFYY